MSADVVHLGRWVPEPDLATKLRAIRRGYGRMIGRQIPQREFAQIIKCGDKAYGAWESGANEPSDLIGLAIKLRDSIGLDPTYLVDIESDPTDPSEQVSKSSPCMTDNVLRFERTAA